MRKPTAAQVRALDERDRLDRREDLVRSAIASAILLIENQDEPELAVNVLRLARDAIEAGAV